MKRIIACIFPLILCLCGCQPEIRVSTAPLEAKQPIRTIALVPDDGVLADTIGIELMNYGFTVIDTGKTTSLMARLNLTEIEIMYPQNLRLLANEGIDAILLANSSYRRGLYDSFQSATAKVILTEDGTLAVGVTLTDPHIRYFANYTPTQAGVEMAKALGGALRK